MLNNVLDNLMASFMLYADFCAAYDVTSKPEQYANLKRELHWKIKKY
jgi:hypothetical protein